MMMRRRIKMMMMMMMMTTTKGMTRMFHCFLFITKATLLAESQKQWCDFFLQNMKTKNMTKTWCFFLFSAQGSPGGVLTSKVGVKTQKHMWCFFLQNIKTKIWHKCFRFFLFSAQGSPGGVLTSKVGVKTQKHTCDVFLFKISKQNYGINVSAFSCSALRAALVEF